MEHKNLVARVFSLAVISLGGLVCLAAFVPWQSAEPVYYLFCFLLAVLSAGWRVGQLSFPGTASILFVFIMISVVHFSLAETLFLGCSALVVQSWMDTRERTSADTLLFRLSNVAIATAAATYVYNVSFDPVTQNLVWPLMAAIFAFTLMHTFAAAVGQALAERRNLIATWHECAYWTIPYYLLGGAIAVGFATLTQHVGWSFSLPTLPVIYFMFRGTSQYLEKLRSTHSGFEALGSSHRRTLETLGVAISARFRAANDELARTQSFALWIAEDLQLPRSEIEALRIATILHDVGTLAVPEQIICKNGALTDEEFDKVKLHPVVGASIIESAEFPVPVAGIVRHHHERWAGDGYPDGLAGEQIPIGARILSVVDCLVALTAERPYRRAVPLDRALSFIAGQSGLAFDPELVELVMQRAHDFRRHTSSQPGEMQMDKPRSGADFVAPISDARRESQEVYALAQELGRAIGIAETLSTFCRRLSSVVPFDSCTIYLRQGDTLKPQYVTGAYSTALEALQIPVGTGPSGSAITTNIPSVNVDPEGEFGGSDKIDLHSALVIPLEGAAGTIGVLTVYRRPKNAFAQNDLRVLLSVRSILASAIENSLRLQEAEASATTDHLTGLPNARSLFQRLETEAARCRRSGGHFTVLLCDLDGFKLVNDRHGHLMGNQVLRDVAHALQRNCREYDYVARMGGDEFVLVLPGLPVGAVEARVRHLSRTIAETAEESCPGCGVTLSAGQARYPSEGKDPETILAAADSKMYAAKQRRRVSSDSCGYDFDAVGV